MEINFDKIDVQLSNNSSDFNEKDKEYFINYIEKCKIINNKGNFLKLRNEMFTFDNILNYKNYDFSERFINLNVIISLLEIFNLTYLNTYKIYEFLNENKEKYNIWKYINSAEYIHYNSPCNYNKLAIVRLCLSYSWQECLYELLQKCLNKNRTYKTFIWIDIFCVNQFNNKIKNKSLNKINDVYYVADIYNISSLDAFGRYWCCYEMSLEKKATDTILINKKELSKKIIYELKNIFNNIFGKSMLYDENNKENNEKIQEYILEFQKKEEFKKNKFSLKNVDITKPEDKIFINSNILNRYKTMKEFENRINIYIYLIKYRDNVEYGYLANQIMKIKN